MLHYECSLAELAVRSSQTNYRTNTHWSLSNQRLRVQPQRKSRCVRKRLGVLRWILPPEVKLYSQNYHWRAGNFSPNHRNILSVCVYCLHKKTWIYWVVHSAESNFLCYSGRTLDLYWQSRTGMESLVETLKKTNEFATKKIMGSICRHKLYSLMINKVQLSRISSLWTHVHIKCSCVIFSVTIRSIQPVYLDHLSLFSVYNLTLALFAITVKLSYRSLTQNARICFLRLIQFVQIKKKNKMFRHQISGWLSIKTNSDVHLYKEMWNRHVTFWRRGYYSKKS